ncbi:uncharacterized protein V1513DRAFT_438126 [Lipomyces chichibuensis]|uniref:uncharacterized protein n=1 Tax=Lipomyces chichibuensis TaxID=1546026 RepID=UPI0033438B30
MLKRSRPGSSSDSDSGSCSDSDSNSDSDSDETSTPFDPAAHKLARSSPSLQQPIIQCTLPPHCNHSPQSFASYPAFEQHYTTSHTLVCTSCARSFPSQHYLDLHFSEFHDPFVAARRDRGEKVYTCFVEGCDKVCADMRKRRLHLIDKHGFPREFMFGLVAHGLRPNQTSLLYPPRKWKQVAGMRPTGCDHRDNNDDSPIGVGEGAGDDDDKGDDTGDIVFRRPDQTADGDGEPEIDADMLAVGRQFQGIKLVPDKIRFGRKTRI